MADATSTETEISVESTVHSVRDLRRVRNEQRTRKRAQITRRFNGGLRHRHRRVSNPPGRPRDGSRRRTGGLLTPPLHQ